MRQKSRQSGQSLIEVTIGIVVFVPVILFLVDFALVLWAVESNARICRSAARAAASGDPAEATARAQAVVERTGDWDTSSAVSASSLVPPVEVRIDREPGGQFSQTSGEYTTPGGPLAGTVTATTEITVKPFVIEMFCGKLAFRAQQSFPITYVVPASGSTDERSESNDL